MKRYKRRGKKKWWNYTYKQSDDNMLIELFLSFLQLANDSEPQDVSLMQMWCKFFKAFLLNLKKAAPQMQDYFFPYLTLFTNVLQF